MQPESDNNPFVQTLIAVLFVSAAGLTWLCYQLKRQLAAIQQKLTSSELNLIQKRKDIAALEDKRKQERAELEKKLTAMQTSLISKEEEYLMLEDEYQFVLKLQTQNKAALAGANESNQLLQSQIKRAREENNSLRNLIANPTGTMKTNSEDKHDRPHIPKVLQLPVIVDMDYQGNRPK